MARGIRGTPSAYADSAIRSLDDVVCWRVSSGHRCVLLEARRGTNATQCFVSSLTVHGLCGRVLLLHAFLALFPQFFSLADDMTTAPSRLPVPSLLQCSTAIPHHPLGRKERRAAADALQTAVFSALRRTAEARSPSSPPSRRRRILSASVGQEGVRDTVPILSLAHLRRKVSG